MPTWHSADLGVALTSERVVMSQLTDITSSEVDCIAFDLTAMVDDGVAITLEIDFLDDGVPEYSHAVTSDDFQEVTYAITPPEWFHDARFRLIKEGVGGATLAQIRARDVDISQCPSEALELVDRPAGAPCEDGAQCADGECTEVYVTSSFLGTVEASCSECGVDGDCEDSDVCALSFADEPVGYGACMAPPERGLGEACLGDSECLTGSCRSGICSDCNTSEDCSDGGECERPTPEGEYPDGTEPYRCTTSLGALETGASCAAHSDCASQSCVGSGGNVQMCLPTGRPCETDDDCDPADTLSVWGDANCVETGIYRGVCE